MVSFNKARVTTGTNYEKGDIVVVTKLGPSSNSTFLAMVTDVVNEDTFYYQELPENWEHEVDP